jgi:hypothetical protein
MNDPRIKYYQEALNKLQENQASLEEMQFVLGLTETQLHDLLYYAKAVEFWSEELKCWSRELGYANDSNLSLGSKIINSG